MHPDRSGRLAAKVQMTNFDPPYGIGFKSNFMSETGRTAATDIPAGDTARSERKRHLPQRHPLLPHEIHERSCCFANC